MSNKKKVIKTNLPQHVIIKTRFFEKTCTRTCLHDPSASRIQLPIPCLVLLQVSRAYDSNLQHINQNQHNATYIININLQHINQNQHNYHDESFGYLSNYLIKFISYKYILLTYIFYTIYYHTLYNIII